MSVCNMPRGGYTPRSKMDPDDYRYCAGCGELLHRDAMHRDEWNDSDYWCEEDECWPARKKQIDNYDGPPDEQLAADAESVPTERTTGYREQMIDAGRGRLL